MTVIHALIMLALHGAALGFMLTALFITIPANLMLSELFEIRKALKK